jgi:protein-disulfide isomerase
VITEFSDFQCPYCRRLKAALDTIMGRYPNDVAVIYRHFPLTKLHPYASPAAYASVCAAQQGRFQGFYDVVFARQDSLGKLPWTAMAARAGVRDTVAFSRCLADSASVQAIAVDRQAGDQLKVRGTPTVLVDKWRVPGTPTTAILDSIVRQELKAGQ